MGTGFNEEGNGTSSSGPLVLEPLAIKQFHPMGKSLFLLMGISKKPTRRHPDTKKDLFFGCLQNRNGNY
jgi:hypothetical protein